MIALSPPLDAHGAIPLYLQLYGYIRSEIEAGTIPAGAKLPAIRTLAAHLKVSKNTVETSYQQLIAEGYAESRSRSGLYTLAIEEPVGGAAATVEPVGAAPQSPRSSKRAVEVAYEYDFRYGDVETERFPMAAWKKCLQAVLDEANPRLALDYGHPQGDEELRSELAAYLFQSRGVPCAAEQIVICAGTQQAIGMLCQLVPLRNARIAMENPGYSGVRTAFLGHGCEIAPIPLDEDGLQVEKLAEASAAAVYVTPSHQFPLGMIMPVQRRNRLLQWANDNDAFIVEDDYDSEYRYVGQPIPALKALDRRDRVIYLGTLSKSFLPAARLSYVVLPESIAGSIREKLRSYSQSASPLIQRATLRFMREGHFGRHVRRMKRLYQTKHRALLSALQRRFGDRIDVIGQKAGLHLLIDVKTDLSGGELIDLALAEGVRVYSPAIQWQNPEHCPPARIMLGFGGLNENKIDDAVRRLAKAWFPGYDGETIGNAEKRGTT
ncbi:PLP-dependent aminotransferase family protein [Cohnella sp. GCM10027633]|uniref:MocR-like pyridoxine biosynthesis transcription factor PdxR n=1 Tax=unclassified Cohnella TaxID=2636738 RepID=UPI003625F945